MLREQLCEIRAVDVVAQVPDINLAAHGCFPVAGLGTRVLLSGCGRKGPTFRPAEGRKGDRRTWSIAKLRRARTAELVRLTYRYYCKRVACRSPAAKGKTR